MESVFARSLFMRPCRIAGVQLRPYSLYHDFALELLQSSYCYVGDAARTLGDTVQALIVCGLSVTDRLHPIERAVQFPMLRAAWYCRVLAHGMGRTTADLNEHIAVYRSVPEVYRDVRSGHDVTKCSGAPWQWHTAVVLAADAGFAWPDVWNLAVCEAMAIKAILNEREPGGPLIADRIRKERERLRAGQRQAT